MKLDSEASVDLTSQHKKKRKKKKESENELNQISKYTKNCIDSNSYLLIRGDFNAKIGKDQKGIVNGDNIISRNDFLLRDMIKMQYLQLINCVPYCVGKSTRVNTFNNNEKSIVDYDLYNSKLASMISKVIIDEPQECKLKGRKYSDHNIFIIDINTKTKHLEMVDKSVWKINEKTDWKKSKDFMQNKIQNMTGTQEVARNTLKKIHTVLHETATKSIGKQKISNNILNNKQIQEAKKIKTNSKT